jgi:hypothetical protein
MKYLLPVIVLVIGVSVLVVHASAAQNEQHRLAILAQQTRETAMQNAKQPYTARFLIFTNGTKRILSSNGYLLQWPYAYLRSDGPTVIHVAKQGVHWQDFFQSLPLTLTAQCLGISQIQQFCTEGENTLKFYLNGVKQDNLLSLEIHDGDRLLISYGAENQVELNDQLVQLAKLP